MIPSILLLLLPSAPAAITPTETGGFRVEHEVIVDDTPRAVFDAFTGDVTGWWDHHFSRNPHAMVLEPKVGGRFYELFDEAGNGALHATVIYVDHGKQIRFTGPLGFSGNALDMVHVVTFEAEGESQTRLKLTVDAAGRVDEGWAEAADRVWHHFLEEQFVPWVAAGEHRGEPHRDEPE